VTTRLPTGLEAMVLQELRASWVDANQKLFGGALRPCVLALESMAALGRWDPASRQIRLSITLVIDRPWLEVVEVLRHEMAHQYVTEVLRVIDEAPHGPTFRKVCEDRGLDGRARSASVKADPAVERIRKLLALAESPNEHEADVALQAALRLMRQRGLAMSEVQAPEQDLTWIQLGDVRARVPKHEQLLAGALTAHFGLQAIYMPAFDVITGKPGRALEVCGRAEQLELVEHLYTVLLRAGEAAWKVWRRENQISSDRQRRTFLEGLAVGIAGKLQREDARMQAEGLVLVSDPAVKAWFGLRHPQVVSRRLSVRLGDAHAAGRSAGEQIDLRPAIKGRQDAAQRRIVDRGEG
jgi:hypothetical protein